MSASFKQIVIKRTQKSLLFRFDDVNILEESISQNMLSKHLPTQFPDITSFGRYNICQLYILVQYQLLECPFINGMPVLGLLEDRIWSNQDRQLHFKLT